MATVTKEVSISLNERDALALNKVLTDWARKSKNMQGSREYSIAIGLVECLDNLQIVLR